MWRRLPPFLMVLWLTTAAVPADVPSAPDPGAPPDVATINAFRRLAEDGAAQMARQDFERAADLYRRMEVLVPSSAQGAFLLAGALARLGHPDEALDALARAVLSDLDDPQAILFDPALVPLRDSPVFEALVRLATLKADALVAGRAVGAGPREVPSFASLDELHAHFDTVEREAARWRPLQTAGEHMKLRWSLLDARRAALTAHARAHPGTAEGDAATLEAIATLGRYRDPMADPELQIARRELSGFEERHAGGPLGPRALWLELHLRRKSLSKAMPPRERAETAAALDGELRSFVAEAGEKDWPEGGLALIDLAALRDAVREGDPREPLERVRRDYPESELVWSYAREQEAGLLLRVLGVPDFRAVDLQGRTRGRADLLGRVVLIDFWATWCGPCVEQLPELARLHRDLADDRRFLLLGVSIDHADDLGGEDFAAFLRDHDMRWPQVRDGKGEESELVRAFGLETVPFQVLVAPDGSVIESGPRVDPAAVRRAVAESAVSD